MEIPKTFKNELESVGINIPSREQIKELQDYLVPIQCPLPEPVHHFAPGIYMRELTVPAGMLIVGKIHKHDHFLLVLSGLALALSEFGNFIAAPGQVVRSAAGVKRIVLALSDTRFLTIHANPDDCDDLKVLESRHIEPEMELGCELKEVVG